MERPERGRHHVPEVGETQQHQRDTQDGVEYSHHLAGLGLGCYVAVPCNTMSHTPASKTLNSQSIEVS